VRPEVALKRKKKEPERDEYRDDDLGEKDRTHRLSRKKKRRLEALKDLEEDKADPNSRAPRAKPKEKKVHEHYEEGLMSTIGLHRNKKVSRPKFAVGGSDIDVFGEDSYENGGKVSKSVQKQMAKIESFTEFDPNKKLRKQGKIGTASFKSKKRYKRR
jgi:hypothetical protein